KPPGPRFGGPRLPPLGQATNCPVPGAGHGAERPGLKRPEAFPAGGQFPPGPATGVPGIWSACGFCAHGVSSAGGVGMAMAQWIAHGDPGLDLSAMALARFAGRMPDSQAVRRGACKVYGTYYDIQAR